MSRRLLLLVTGLFFVFASWAGADQPSAAGKQNLRLEARVQVETEQGSDRYQTVAKGLDWNPRETAIVICDMWDKHWCRGATSRVQEMATRMNEVVSAARSRGILIIHCPSSCMSFYKDTPMRKLAQQAPAVDTEIPLQTWCHLDSERESPLPIDDSDGGCDCWPRCETGSPWKRQIASISIEPGDAITDSAEAYYLMKQRGVKNVIVMGVHTNMCVLGRPFSIRQLVYQGQNVVLMRDMTDTMYNSRMSPHVAHVRGTDLVIVHIERHWCPTVVSTAFTGKPPFKFSEDGQPHIVFVVGEREYKTKDTLPKFAAEHLETRGMRCTFVHADPEDGNLFPGLESLKTADLLFVSVRRRSLPAAQLQLIREYLDAGRPMIGIRTASHAFHTRGQHPDGHAEWQEFDPLVLGGNYRGHHGAGPKTTITAAEGVDSHPILRNLSVASFVGNGSLYQVKPLQKTAMPILIGAVGELPHEPVAWTHKYKNGRIFYTSLGHPEDFQQEDFNRLLGNAVLWALGKPVEPAE